ncbi:MAG TPA: DNA repair protein RecO [Candidatus Saccharimonadales bacterium]|nr:DNA repair protein RecO [Candidatus Saccharimonadales bacterium]
MKQLQTTGIVLSRTNFGEADRIITLLTPDQGKLRLMARGVRKAKSKLAGGIELFSVSDITFIQGRSEIGTLISSRLRQHYGLIVKDLNRVQLGYDLIKMLNKITEDEPEPEYFTLLSQAFIALDDAAINLDLIRAWFEAQLLKQAGHTPNLVTDTTGQKLTADQSYNFDHDAMALAPNPHGTLGANQIKFLRLLFSQNSPQALNKVQGSNNLTQTCGRLVQQMANFHLH